MIKLRRYLCEGHGRTRGGGCPYAAAMLFIALTACTEKPLVISADTSCERFRHISANDAQLAVFSENWAVMESYADQILAHNAEYDAHCLKDPPK